MSEKKCTFTPLKYKWCGTCVSKDETARESVEFEYRSKWDEEAV